MVQQLFALYVASWLEGPPRCNPSHVAQQKGEGYFNLAKVTSVAAEHHVTPTLSSHTLETDSMCAMCMYRVTPECKFAIAGT